MIVESERMESEGEISGGTDWKEESHREVKGDSYKEEERDTRASELAEMPG